MVRSTISGVLPDVFSYISSHFVSCNDFNYTGRMLHSSCIIRIWLECCFMVEVPMAEGHQLSLRLGGINYELLGSSQFWKLVCPVNRFVSIYMPVHQDAHTGTYGKWGGPEYSGWTQQKQTFSFVFWPKFLKYLANINGKHPQSNFNFQESRLLLLHFFCLHPWRSLYDYETLFSINLMYVSFPSSLSTLAW